MPFYSMKSFFFIKKHSRIDKIGYLYKNFQDDTFCCL